MSGTDSRSFYEVITAAISDLAEHGYDSEERVQHWTMLIRAAAVRSMTPEYVLRQALTGGLAKIYQRDVEGFGLLRRNPEVPRYTIDKLKPQMRAELHRRIMASASLIRLNREASIQRTLQRFSGWSTSIPAGGSDAVSKQEVKADLRKALSQLPFEERRVIIDQGHKFTAALNDIVAINGGAIAGEWHSHWQQLNYNYRKDHKERDKKVYALRDSWAMQEGLMNKGDGYLDEMTAPGEEVFCRCYLRYIYSVSKLPDSMITAKGRAKLEQARKILA